MKLYIDAGFQPSIKPADLDGTSLQIMEDLRIPARGQPAPTTEGSRAAYWRGDFNDCDEAPVLAVNVPTNERFSLSASWFIGILGEEAVQQYDDLAVACIEAAQYQAPSLPFALQTLAQFLSR